MNPTTRFNERADDYARSRPAYGEDALDFILADCSNPLRVAFHWFAGDAALAEFRRILRPGGRVAFVLNERDEREPFTAAYGQLYGRYALDDTEQRRLRSSAIFKRLPGRCVEREFAQGQSLDRDGLWHRTISSSYMPNTGAAAQALHTEVDELFDRFSHGGAVRIALRTIVVRIDLDPAV